MWIRTQNRVVALMLGCCLSPGVQAQDRDPNQVPGTVNPGNLQDQRLNRMPLQRPHPVDSYPTPPSGTGSALPPAPVKAASSEPAAAALGTAVRVQETPARRATVGYTDGKLSIVAANSSLNQILRDISRAAGIMITGGVTEERVFGNYGPGVPAQVLNDLLDGTDSNILYMQGAGSHRSELVLTPRTGGPTPPNPSAVHIDAVDSTPPLPPADAASDNAAASSQPNAPQAAPPTDNNGTPPPDSSSAQPAASGSSSGDSSSSSDSSSSGAKTPQQIFDQLMKLRQQNQ